MKFSLLEVAKEIKIISGRPTNASRLAVAIYPAQVNLYSFHLLIRKFFMYLNIISIMVCLVPECEHAICPISNQRYLERGCLPEYKDNACCPTSFRCRKSSLLIDQ